MGELESGAGSSVSTETGSLLCEWCGDPIASSDKPRRRRRFCSDRHRNAWHQAERAKVEVRAKAAIQTLAECIALLSKKGRR